MNSNSQFSLLPDSICLWAHIVSLTGSQEDIKTTRGKTRFRSSLSNNRKRKKKKKHWKIDFLIHMQSNIQCRDIYLIGPESFVVIDWKYVWIVVRRLNLCLVQILLGVIHFCRVPESRRARTLWAGRVVNKRPIMAVMAHRLRRHSMKLLSSSLSIFLLIPSRRSPSFKNVNGLKKNKQMERLKWQHCTLGQSLFLCWHQLFQRYCWCWVFPATRY